MRPSHYHSRTRDELTERQRDVLALLARGKTNPQIAETLGMTLDGAKFHVSEILTKLDVSTREEAGAWWREERSIKQRALRGVGWLTGGWRWLAVGGSALAVAAIGGGLAAWMLMDSGSAPQPNDDVVFQLTPPGGAPEIVTYSPTAHAIVHQFPAPADASGEAWMPAASAGDYIAFVSKDREVMVRDLHGGNERILYDSTAQVFAPIVEPSPDGKFFAILDNPGNDVSPIVAIVDPATGQEMLRVEERLATFTSPFGNAYSLLWHTDSRGLTVQVTGGHEAGQVPPASFANISLNGTVRITPASPDDMVSPDGRFIAYAAAFDPKCGDLGSQSAIRIADLATGKTVARIDDSQGRLRLWRWAADSSAVAYQVYDAPACSPHEDTAAWWALPVDGASPNRISGENALEGSGRGPLVQVDCGYPWIDTLAQPSYGPVSHYGGDCLSSFTRDTAEPVPSKYNNVGHMLIDGHLAFLFDSFQFVGFATPSASEPSTTSPTARASDDLRPCTLGDSTFAFNAEPDDGDIILSVAASGPAPCQIDVEAHLMLVPMATVDPAANLPDWESLASDIHISAELPATGPLATWRWSNWCSPADIPFEWRLVAGETPVRMQVHVPLDAYWSCANSGAATTLVLQDAAGEIAVRAETTLTRFSALGTRFYPTFRTLTAVPYAQISVQFGPISEVSKRIATMAFAPFAVASSTIRSMTW